ncbi:MAG: glucose/sorbosone dehydrogenase-like protein [Deltaproteobacteria bacterium]|nr:glucose/sorbosone dehydrogenase-like protein [Deltaproteobacteria bacterium]
MKPNSMAALIIAVFWLLFPGTTGCGSDPFPGSIKLPPGFRIETYAKVPDARSMTLGERGTLFVGTRREKVYAVLPGETAGGIHKVVTIARDLNQPNGVAFRGGALYVAEIGRILRYDGIESRLSSPPEPVVVDERFPKDRHHGWKFIAFGPDGMLYIPVGAPCNVCERADPRYAAILRMRADGTGLEVFASGVRNTVGFDWHPQTGELWFTDNGRDGLGDDLPPDEVNRAPVKGLHFGFPYVHGKTLPDPEFGARGKPAGFTPPEWELPAHAASLGMRFYSGTMFPPGYRGRIFIAEHGSWDRSTPIGYRVSLVRLEGNRVAGYEVFAEGWLRGDKPWGRPVDVQVIADGSLLVSDDKSGTIYRISYEGKREASAARQ